MRHCWAQPLLADPRLFFESRMAATPAAATAPELTAASPPAPPEPALTLTEYSSLALETAVALDRTAPRVCLYDVDSRRVSDRDVEYSFSATVSIVFNQIRIVSKFCQKLSESPTCVRI